MVQGGIGGLDTPRTNLGDATFLSNQQLELEMSLEQSFQSPSKDNNNLIQHLQNGRRGVIKTPRSRVALSDRRNLPAGLGGGEFTPLLKNATRNSALRNGKENVPQTPAFLKPGGMDNIQEDLTPLPMNSSAYGGSRNGSYMVGTPMPHIDSSSTASTPMALLPRRNEGPGALQDGNQLSLREQENVIDKIEKENFGLKLKIHFLEEALRKAGPGFSEAALKENTELKVDKVTMQKELYRYRKTLTAAERDVELYRQQLIEMQDKLRRKHADEGQKEELERLRQALEEREGDLSRLRGEEGRFEDLEEKINDLQDDLREKDRIIEDREDEVENLKDEVEKQADMISTLEDSIKSAQRRAVELEEQAQDNEELEEAKETIEDLEQQVKRLKQDAEEAREECQEAIQDKERAEADLEELQDEMANKSITTKGLSRQIEEKANRMHDDLENLREQHAALEDKYAEKLRDIKKLEDQIEDLKQDHEVKEQKLNDRLELVQNEKDASLRERHNLTHRLETVEKELQQKADEKNILQLRHDSLTSESASLQRELAKSRKEVEDLEDKLDHEKTLALNNEREVRDQYKVEIDRLHDEVEDIRSSLREKERLYDEDSDKWDAERRTLESQRDIATEKASGLQRTIDRLQEAEGTLSGKEMKMQEALESEKSRHRGQEAILTRQIDELNEDIQARRKSLEEVRSELLGVREELRLSQREQKSLAEKVEGLEDEIEILQTSLDEESDQANKDIIAAKVESDNLRKEIKSLKQDLVRVENSLAHAQSDIKTFEGDLEAGDGGKEQLNARLRDTEMHLSKVRQEKQALQDQLASINIDLHSLRVSKADAEAERDEFQSQLRAIKQQEEETFRLDQERLDLRTTKMRLDTEVRRLRDENKAVIAQQAAVERELQEELERASSEESRLKSEIQDLQKILRGSSEKRELASARTTIQKLEQQVQHLEAQVSSNIDHGDATLELSIIRRDLSAARQRESEFVQREAAQKETLRGLKRQITELEQKAHDAEMSRFASSSPRSSVSGSARKSEVVEIRAQLATAHQSLKEVRGQLKEAEKDSKRRLNAANLDLQNKTTIWETEKDELERSLDEAHFKREELESKNTASEATIVRLRGKVERLEKALNAERLNSGEDRTMVQERRDLHEMLRETQLQAESLEIVVEERERTIATISATESKLRTQLKRVREERGILKDKATTAQGQLHLLEVTFKNAKDAWESKIAESSVAQDKLLALEAKFRKSKDLWDARKINSAATQEELTSLESKYKKAHEAWEAEKTKSISIQGKLNALESRYKKARDSWEVERATFVTTQERLTSLESKFENARRAWDDEKAELCRGVRFANQSISSISEQSQIMALKQEWEEKAHYHVKEMRGMELQVGYLVEKYKREKMFREELAWAKVYMGLQIEAFHACNRADIALLESSGIPRPIRKPKKKKLGAFFQVIRAMVRMRRGAIGWKAAKAPYVPLLEAQQQMRLEAAKSTPTKSTASDRQ